MPSSPDWPCDLSLQQVRKFATVGHYFDVSDGVIAFGVLALVYCSAAVLEARAFAHRIQARGPASERERTEPTDQELVTADLLRLHSQVSTASSDLPDLTPTKTKC